MDYKINMTSFGQIFPFPSIVADKHIRLASEVAIKTLLVILRNSQSPPSAQIIAQILGITDYEVSEAIEYWIQLDILTGSAYKESTPIYLEKHEPQKAEQKKSESVTPATKPPTRVQLPRKEALDYIKKREDLNSLVHIIQQKTGRELTSADMDSLAGLHSYYGLSSDYILMAVLYCHGKGKTGLRYVEKTIASWLENGIDDHEKLDNYIMKLSEMNNRHWIIKSILGIRDRDLVKKERDFVIKWTDEYKFDDMMIKLAYEKTVEGTGKLSFPYMDKIMQNWVKSGFTTTREVADGDSKRKATTESAPSYDEDKLDKLIYGDYLNTEI